MDEELTVEAQPTSPAANNAAGLTWLPTVFLLCSILLVLLISSLVSYLLKRAPEGSTDPALVRTFNRRANAWIIIYSILLIALLIGKFACVVLFGLVSFWALREFITMTPTRRADHGALFMTFFIFTPAQYILVGLGSGFYGIYSIMIPVYASLILPAWIAFSDDQKRFLERSAKIQFGLLVCVYAVSYAPALLYLDLKTWDAVNAQHADWKGNPAGLLVYLVLIVQLSELLHYLWDHYGGKHVIAPSISTSKTWEGFFGGAISSAVIGVLLWFTGITPFTFYGSALMALVITIMGFFGSMTMSAIKRDRGVADYGTLVQGHAGVLDRIDALCFAAPVFFHLTRYFLYVLPNS